jgi:hypothetical protein
MVGGTADFTYGYAVEMLCGVWGFGEELKAKYRRLLG